MNAMEKVAWTEVIVAGLAIVAAAVSSIWLGHAASAALAILGFVLFGAIFLRRRGNEIVTDERDHSIEKDATNRAVHLTWITMVISLAGLTLFFGSRDANIPNRYLVWLVWLQFALLYLTKGLITLRAYRGISHAAKG